MTLSIFKGCSRALCLDDKGYDGLFTKGVLYTVTNVCGDYWLELIDNSGELNMVASIHACNDFAPIDDNTNSGITVLNQLFDIVGGNINDHRYHLQA